MILATERRVIVGAALVLATMLIGSGSAIGGDADSKSDDAKRWAEAIEAHFRIEHRADMEPAVAIDAATRPASCE